MIFVIYLTTAPRKNEWNGEIIRTGGVGVSGSETTIVSFSEYIASKGHNVYLCCNNVKESIHNQVTYTKSFPNSKVECLIYHQWENSLPSYDMPNLKCCIAYFQCVGNCVLHNNLISKFPTIKTMAIYPSQWAKDATEHFNRQRFIALNSLVIHSAFLTNTTEDVAEKTNQSMVWLASWERGGDVALKVFEKLQWPSKNFFRNDYYHHSFSQDKQSISKILSQSDYFVYPLVLQDGRVHKDTFACCVSEALAHGVIVISFGIAALKELYDGYVDFIDFPTNAKITELENYDFIRDNSLLSSEVVESIIKIIHFYEFNKEKKREKQRKNRQFALHTFSIETTGSKIDDALDYILI